MSCAGEYRNPILVVRGLTLRRVEHEEKDSTCLRHVEREALWQVQYVNVVDFRDHLQYLSERICFLTARGFPPCTVSRRVEEQYLRDHGWGPRITPVLHATCRGLGYRNQRPTVSHGRETLHHTGAGPESCRGTGWSSVVRNTSVAPTGRVGEEINQVLDVIDANDWKYVETTFAASGVEPLRVLSEDLMAPSARDAHDESCLSSP